MRRALPPMFALALAACDDMVEQPKLTTYGEAQAFDDGAAVRPVPPGTAARDAALDVPPPAEVTAATLALGRERYDVFCAPCHGLSGHGDGMIVQRGFPAPPSLHAPELMAAPAARVFDVITEGWGVMYSYRDRVPPAERWAIVAYIRALQLSQSGGGA